MALFKVVKVLNGNTIEVNEWEFEKKNEKEKGTIVVIQDYDPPSLGYHTVAKSILETLILNKEVELRRATGIITLENGISAVKCSVFFNDINISQYLPTVSAPAELPQPLRIRSKEHA